MATKVTQMVTHRTLVLRGSLGLSKLGLRREVPSMLTHTINVVNITFNIVFIDRLSFGFELDNVNLMIQLLWRDQVVVILIQIIQFPCNYNKDLHLHFLPHLLCLQKWEWEKLGSNIALRRYQIQNLGRDLVVARFAIPWIYKRS